MKESELYWLELEDTQWPFDYTDHDRQVVRAIVIDDAGWYYFCRAVRDDEFGKSTLIETSGGGVEPGEDLHTAIKRELKEELGAEVEILCKLGVVSDYYNLIHRHNYNHYFLCRALSIGSKNLTEQEIAEREKTSQGKISECLAPALKKIKRIFRIRQVSPDIRRRF